MNTLSKTSINKMSVAQRRTHLADVYGHNPDDLAAMTGPQLTDLILAAQDSATDHTPLQGVIDDLFDADEPSAVAELLDAPAMNEIAEVEGTGIRSYNPGSMKAVRAAFRALSDEVEEAEEAITIAAIFTSSIRSVHVTIRPDGFIIGGTLFAERKLAYAEMKILLFDNTDPDVNE